MELLVAHLQILMEMLPTAVPGPLTAAGAESPLVHLQSGSCEPQSRSPLQQLTVWGEHLSHNSSPKPKPWHQNLDHFRAPTLCQRKDQHMNGICALLFVYYTSFPCAYGRAPMRLYSRFLDRVDATSFIAPRPPDRFRRKRPVPDNQTV